ncbi:hypothetical protein QQF64_002155 [Cirrhinus molitorella]|uniref:Uncharacterized protein n=1 Tax=Cirrhinus molitorella TaxID=172907 RepID=A0ABR3MPC2_9TELE
MLVASEFWLPCVGREGSGPPVKPQPSDTAKGGSQRIVEDLKDIAPHRGTENTTDYTRMVFRGPTQVQTRESAHILMVAELPASIANLSALTHENSGPHTKFESQFRLQFKLTYQAEHKLFPKHPGDGEERERMVKPSGSRCQSGRIHLDRDG